MSCLGEEKAVSWVEWVGTQVFSNPRIYNGGMKVFALLFPGVCYINNGTDSCFLSGRDLDSS